MVQARILRLLREVRDDLGMSILLITHDIGVVNELCDRVAVLYGGRIVEEGPCRWFWAVRAIYTRRLLSPAQPGRRPRQMAAATKGGE